VAHHRRSKVMLVAIRNLLIAWKFYIIRSSSYITLLNLGMIMFLSISKLKDYGYISLNLGQYLIPFFFITLFLLILFGYIDVKFFKGFKAEIEIANLNTPLHPKLAELKQKVDYLYEKEMKNEPH
jgi:hypothetical protein